MGVDARHCGAGSEDRDHRLGDRPRSPVLRSDRIHDAPGLSEGSAALHHREGDRRSRVRSEKWRHGSERTIGLQRGRLESRHARRRHRSRERRHRDGPGARLGRRASRIPRQLQGLRRDRLGPQPERELTRDRCRDRGCSRGRHGRHQLLGRRARDRAEPGYRRARARCGCCSRSRASGCGGERLQRLRRRLGLVAGQLGRGDQRRRRRDQPDDAHACGVLVRRPDDDLASAQAGRRRARRRRALLRLGRRLGRTLRDEHGGAARRGRCGPPAPASPGVDGGTGQVCPRPVRQSTPSRVAIARPARASRAAASSH